jgi:hypothetical protein
MLISLSIKRSQARKAIPRKVLDNQYNTFGRTLRCPIEKTPSIGISLRYPLQCIVLVALMGLLVSCDDPVTQIIRKHQTKSGLDAALAQLPRSKEFEVIKSVTFEYVDSDLGFSPDHYLARGYTVLGSSFPEQEAVNAYFQMVQVNGWIPRSDQYEDSKVLRRGSNELMEITFDLPGDAIMNVSEYTKAQGRYSSVIFIRVDISAP